jgi:hypothetical protein
MKAGLFCHGPDARNPKDCAGRRLDRLVRCAGVRSAVFNIDRCGVRPRSAGPPARYGALGNCHRLRISTAAALSLLTGPSHSRCATRRSRVSSVWPDPSAQSKKSSYRVRRNPLAFQPRKYRSPATDWSETYGTWKPVVSLQIPSDKQGTADDAQIFSRRNHAFERVPLPPRARPAEWDGSNHRRLGFVVFVSRGGS